MVSEKSGTPRGHSIRRGVTLRAAAGVALFFAPSLTFARRACRRCLVGGLWKRVVER